jgi:hypothetical protein
MLLIVGLSAAMQYVVFGGAILVGMVISGDRVASLLGWWMKPTRTSPRVATGGD